MKATGRCDWGERGGELLRRYHDTEWGVPVYDDGKQFEFLVLEGAQAATKTAVDSMAEGVADALAIPGTATQPEATPVNIDWNGIQQMATSGKVGNCCSCVALLLILN